MDGRLALHARVHRARVHVERGIFHAHELVERPGAVAVALGMPCPDIAGVRGGEHPGLVHSWSIGLLRSSSRTILFVSRNGSRPSVPPPPPTPGCLNPPDTVPKSNR